MKTSSNQPESPDLNLPDLDLPTLPEVARRPPLLTMDQYLAWNTRDEFEPALPSQVSDKDRCLALFEL